MIRIGVFDSGVGGLSVLRALWHELPSAHYLYFADSAFAPYGDKDDDYIISRSAHISETLLAQGIDLLVIACNTATAIAAAHIRKRHPALPIVAIEPAIKPAALMSQTKRIGVMATAGTVASQRFQELLQRVHEANPATHFQVIACEGLALAIEQSFITQNKASAEALAQHFAAQLQDIDTLVLGCTHYPFVQDALQQYFVTHSRQAVHIIEPSKAVAQQAKRLIQSIAPRWNGNTLEHSPSPAYTPTAAPPTTLLSSGDTSLLQAAHAFISQRY